MRNILFLIDVRAILITGVLGAAHSAEEAEKVLVIRAAKEDLTAAVTVDGYLMGNLFDVKVSAWMQGETPKITNVLIVGPGVGQGRPTPPAKGGLFQQSRLSGPRVVPPGYSYFCFV